MALIHADATLTPTKAEIVRAWVGATDWFDGDPETIDLRPGSLTDSTIRQARSASRRSSYATATG
jgi:hypothetical protein